jgi:hypothetical protein
MVEGLTYIEDLPFMVVLQFLSLFSFARCSGFACRRRGVEQW